MNIAIIGTGYVGLVAGACFSTKNNQVICVDNNREKIKKLQNSIIEIYEPDLDKLVKENLKENKLIFSDDIDYAVKNSQVIFIAVGTPQDKNGCADLSSVYAVVEDIAKAMDGYKIIVEKSTVPVGTSKILEKIIKKHTNYNFDLVSNPEFLKQGSALNDFLNPDRVIIGSNSTNAINILKEIYMPFCKAEKILVMDINSAEMTKYASNCFLAAKISYINEIAQICEKIGANIDNVRLGMSLDKRIGADFLSAGIGYGGSCFPKDVAALISIASDNLVDNSILKAIEKRNNLQKELFVEKILKYFNYDIKNKTFALWGLSFKPETNDIREAPSIDIIQNLLNNGAKINAYDPKALNGIKKIFDNKIKYFTSPYDALDECDALLVLTEWSEFKNVDFKKVKVLLKNPLIFDGRNLYDIKKLKDFGFSCHQIGK